MNKKKVSIILVILSLALLIFILSGKIIYPKKSTQLEINNPSQTKDEISIKPVNIEDDIAPEIQNAGKWINTDKDLTLNDFKGKVVLIEFWTFGCYNCTNTLPFLKEWYEKYKSDNFEIIGIHCPEFDNERNFNNVKRSVDELGIKYPVLTDNDFSVWSKYDVHVWPTIFLIVKNGEIRYKKISEGKFDKTESMIRSLLKEPYGDTKN